MGTLVGTVGTVLFYGTATLNLAWQHIGWKAVEDRNYKKLYEVDWLYPMDFSLGVFIYSNANYG